MLAALHAGSQANNAGTIPVGKHAKIGGAAKTAMPGGRLPPGAEYRPGAGVLGQAQAAVTVSVMGCCYVLDGLGGLCRKRRIAGIFSMMMLAPMVCSIGMTAGRPLVGPL
jgi:hypothetical protein